MAHRQLGVDELICDSDLKCTRVAGGWRVIYIDAPAKLLLEERCQTFGKALIGSAATELDVHWHACYT